MQVLKVRVPDVGFKPFCPQGEGPGFEFLPHCGSLHQGWSLFLNCVLASLTLFNVGFLSFAECVEVTQLVFRFFAFFFPRGTSSICSCRYSVSVGGGEFRIFLRHHQEHIPKIFPHDFT